MVNAVRVEKPRSVEELAKVLGEAAAAGLVVTPVGGGRASGMGGMLAHCDVELMTAALDRIIVHKDLNIEAAGVHMSAIARRASDHLPIWARLSA